MTRVVPVKVELLTAEAFAPFGEVMSAESREPDFHGLSSVGWKLPFSATAEPLIMTLSSRYTGMRFTKLERHLNVTQTFIPLGRVPSVIAVAAPTAGDRIPEPEDVHAFILDGTAGYSLKKGAWHTLDRYPLYPPSAEIVIISSRDTQQELETAPRGTWRLTNEVDYVEQMGVTFELEL
jgi:ureidoglycolate lyase